MRLEQAIELARRFHDGQTDKAGRPYLGHVLRVADAVSEHDEKLTAICHDLLEDTVLTRGDLVCAGCPERVVLAVEALTRSPGEEYDDFLRRAAANPIALVVKRADVGDNANEARLALLDPDQADGLREKYHRAQEVLSEATSNLASSESDPKELFAEIGIPEDAGDASATFWCSVCGRPAGTITLTRRDVGELIFEPGNYLVLQTFLGRMSPPIADGDVDVVRSDLERRDAKSFYDRNHELAPFWCPTCAATYCKAHWEIEWRFDDGFFDNIVGTCPEGHCRELWD